jgi:hypothetical protein
MRIQCNACGAAEARVLCCADEAALCVACDEEVHAANKLAGKHQRVQLLTDSATAAASPAPAVPKCDICQVRPRALAHLCCPPPSIPVVGSGWGDLESSRTSRVGLMPDDLASAMNRRLKQSCC